MSTLFYFWEADVLAEVDEFGVDEVVEYLLVITVYSWLFHEYSGPHHWLIGRCVGKWHILSKFELQILFLGLHKFGIDGVPQSFFLHILLEVGSLERTDSFLHSFYFLLFSLDLNLILYHYLFFFLSLQYSSRLFKFIVKSTHNIVN